MGWQKCDGIMSQVFGFVYNKKEPLPQPFLMKRNAPLRKNVAAVYDLFFCLDVPDSNDLVVDVVGDVE